MNRGYWEEKLCKEYMCIVCSGGCSILLMFDIDYFKKVNDEYGYCGGDEVLCYIVDLFRKILCEIDLVGCYGGEEFVVILLDIDFDGV